MSKVKTKLINITAYSDILETVLSRFVNLHFFQPVLASSIVESVHGLTTFSTDNPCQVIVKEIDEIEELSKHIFPVQESKTLECEMEKMKAFVKDVHTKLNSILLEQNTALETARKFQDAIIQVKNIESMDISFDDVFHCDYICARVGRLPSDSIEKLQFYRNKPFIFQPFSEDKSYSWCMYFTTNKYEREVDNIFSSLFFERIYIPDFVHGTPEEATVALSNKIKEAEEIASNASQQIQALIEENKEKLSSIKSKLMVLNRVYKAKKYVIGLGGTFRITGFIKETDVEKAIDAFKDLEDVEVEVRPSHSDKRLHPPTKFKNDWFI